MFLDTPPAKAGGFTLATKVAFRLKPVWLLLKQAYVIPPQSGRSHQHLPVAQYLCLITSSVTFPLLQQK